MNPAHALFCGTGSKLAYRHMRIVAIGNKILNEVFLRIKLWYDDRKLSYIQVYLHTIILLGLLSHYQAPKV